MVTCSIPTRRAVRDGVGLYSQAGALPAASREDLIGQLRERMWSQGNLIAKVREGKEDEGKKYSDYFDFAEPFGRLKAHRVLAMFRAEKEEILDLTLDHADEGNDGLTESYERPIAERFGIEDRGRAADPDRGAEHEGRRSAAPHALPRQRRGGAPGARPQIGAGERGGAEIDGDLARPGVRGRLEDASHGSPRAHGGRHSRIV